MNVVRSKWMLVVGGGLLGFAYYYFIGCTTGTCPIQSNPVGSTLYGSLVGLAISMSLPGSAKQSDE